MARPDVHNPDEISQPGIEFHRIGEKVAGTVKYALSALSRECSLFGIWGLRGPKFPIIYLMNKKPSDPADNFPDSASMRSVDCHYFRSCMTSGSGDTSLQAKGVPCPGPYFILSTSDKSMVATAYNADACSSSKHA